MRALLEFLGLAAPGRARREPVALPAAARWLWLTLLVFMTVVSSLLLAVVRGLLQ